MEQAGDARQGHEQPDGESLGDLTELVALPEHCEARGDHCNRKTDLGHADGPAGTAVDDPADDASLSEVDGQAGQQATQHQAESQHLVGPARERGTAHASQEGLAGLLATIRPPPIGGVGRLGTVVAVLSASASTLRNARLAG